MSDSYKIELDGDAAKLKAASAVAKDALKGVQGAADDATGSVKEIGDQAESTGHRSQQSLLDMHAALGLVQQGLGIAQKAAQAFGQATQEAFEKQVKLNESLQAQRLANREIAYLSGEQSNTKFAIEQQKFNVATAMTPEQGLAFKTEYLNSGVQYKGKTIDESEFEQFAQQAAALAAARNIEASAGGDVAGKLLGFTDRKKYGKGASEHALGKLSSGLAILGQGTGDTNVLARQFAMLSAASLNEDEMKGIFQDSDEVATVISVAAEKHDAQAAEMIKGAIRGIRSNNSKVVDLKARAKIDAKTPFIESVKRIAPLIEKEAKDRGLKVEDVLSEYFDSDLERDALSVLINKGVSGGLFEAREQLAKSVQGPGPAFADIQKYQTEPDQAGLTVIAQQQSRLADLQRAQQTDQLATLREQAKAERSALPGTGTTGEFLKNKLIQFGTFGMANPEQAREEWQMEEILSRRAKAVGLNITPKEIDNRLNDTPETANRIFTDIMEKIQKAGGNPLADSGVLPVLKDISEGIQELNRRLPAGPAQQPVPPPLSSGAAPWNPRP